MYQYLTYPSIRQFHGFTLVKKPPSPVSFTAMSGDDVYTVE